MEKDFFGMDKEKLNIVLLLVFGLFLIYSYLFIKYPQLAVDYGWISEPAYNYLEHGQFATVSRAGYMHLEEATFWWPPVYFALEIIVYSLFGFGITRNFYLLALILGLTFVFTYLLSKKLFNKEVAVLSAAILVSNTMLFKFAFFENRPDVLVALFNLAAVYLFITHLENGKKRYLFSAGILAGMSAMSHIVGSLMAASLFFCLIITQRKKYKDLFQKAAVLLGGATLAIIPWFLYALGNLPVFSEQFLTRSTVFRGYSILLESERYRNLFGSSAMMVLALVFIASLAYGMIKIKEDATKILLAIVVAHLALFFFVPSKTGQHFSSIIPLWTVLSAKMIYDFINSGKMKKNIAFFVLLSVFIYGAATQFAWAEVRVHSNNFYSLEQYLSENYALSENEKIIATSPFFFIYREGLYDIEAIAGRMGKNASLRFGSAMTEIRPKYLIVDSFMLGTKIKNTNSVLHAGISEFLQKNATLLEQVCFVGDTRSHDPDLQEAVYYNNKRASEMFLKALENPGLCLDPIVIYRVNSQ